MRQGFLDMVLDVKLTENQMKTFMLSTTSLVAVNKKK